MDVFSTDSTLFTTRPRAARQAFAGAVAGLAIVLLATPASAQDSPAAAFAAPAPSAGTANPFAPLPDGAAQTSEPSPLNPLRPDGGTVWGVFYGFGVNQEINNSAEGIHAATLGFRWSKMWDARLGSFLRGHPGFGIELIPLTTFVQANKVTWSGGFNLLYEHHFAVTGRVLPVFKIGAGFLYSDVELPEGETRHNFRLLSELGVNIMLTESSAMFVSYRFDHVSNANTGNVNPGVNLHTMMLGLSFYR